MDVPLYILAGGRSSRFGSDKARALVNGQPLILHATEQARALCAPATVVADRPGKYDDLGLPTIGDLAPGLGPMGGLLAALSHRPSPGWILLHPCDAVVILCDALPALLALRSEDADVVAVGSASNYRFWEPLPALYHTRLVPAIRAFIERGERSLIELIGRSRSTPHDPHAPWLRGFNTPAELADYSAVRSARSRSN
jgi:molybdopterin-guanine dinucleotide biosynthesis protein A